MTADPEETACYVTELEKCWPVCDGVDYAVMRTEKMTDGHIGNKAFKLSAVLSRQPDSIMSFGGAWSNHLHALAYLCWQRGIKTVGVIRSGESSDNLLQRSLKRYGMHLHFVSREEYRRRDDSDYCEALCRQLGCSLWLPEGGSGLTAVSGCSSIGTLINQCGFRPDVVVLPVGTGATMAGVVRGIDADVRVIGMPVVRDDKVRLNIQRWVADSKVHWALTQPLQPAYGKVTDSLLQFMVDFFCRSQILLDPLYTGKAIRFCMEPDFLEGLQRPKRVLFVHTGGLLGNYGFTQRFCALPDKQQVGKFLGALDKCCHPHLSAREPAR